MGDIRSQEQGEVGRVMPSLGSTLRPRASHVWLALSYNVSMPAGEIRRLLNTSEWWGATRKLRCCSRDSSGWLSVRSGQRLCQPHASDEVRHRRCARQSDDERRAATRAITVSSRNDYREYVNSVLDDIEGAESVGNMRKVTKLTRTLANKDRVSNINPSKGADGKKIVSTTHLLGEWKTFLGSKFKRSGKATGWDNIPIEAYRGSCGARDELFRICRLMWTTEQIPADLVRGIFVMLYKKGQRDDFGNYRAICLLCHAYKLLSAVVARRLMDVLDGHLPDTQAGFRPARGCRDNVCALRWFIAMVLREGRHAVITFIDYSAAFDTESQLFLDSALADAGVSVKVRRIIQAIFAAATGVVRIRQPSGDNMLSDPFNIERGVLQGDIFSPVCFIAGLDRIFRLHDVANSGMVVGEAESAILVSKFEYADDAALVDENAALASTRVTALATGSMTDAAMLISIKKSKAMHVHKPVRVDATTEADVATLGLSHKCDSCGREFTKQRGLRVHVARWCDGGRTQRSRLGTLTDKAVKTAKRRVAESALDKVYVGNEALDNVLHFEYLGSQLQGDGEDEADVRHRMDIAQAAFGSLSHLWSDHRQSRATKLRLYRVSVCSTLTHSCEAWTFTRTVVRMINGFNSRCLYAITGEDYRTTATVPVYNLVLAVRKRRLRYLGHVLRLPAESIVRRSLLALVKGGAQYPEGSLFSDCEAALPQLEALSLDRSAWRDKVSSLTWTVTFYMWFCLNVVS